MGIYVLTITTLNAKHERIEVPIELSIDTQSLAQLLGERAYHNKIGKSEGMNGRIKCRLVEPRDN